MTSDDARIRIGVREGGSPPSKAQPDWPAAVIAGASRTGELGMRSLYRRGVRVTCFDLDRVVAGFRSPYGRAHACPNPDVFPKAWVQFMLELADEMGDRPVLISSADQFVSAIAEHEEVLRTRYRISPAAHLHGLLATKEKQYTLASEHGLPLPRTRIVADDADLEAFLAEASFPCVLKPLHFREWQLLPLKHPLADKKVVIATTPRELTDWWRIASRVGSQAIVQEIIQGPDTDKRVYLSCYDSRGRRVGNALFRELRCFPAGFGPASVSEPVDDRETDAICDEFLRRIGYSGICEIEMKRDARDGKVKLIEANPRLSGGGDAAPHAGVDLCWLHYLDLMGAELDAVTPLERDFRHVVLRADAPAIFANLRAGLISWRDVFAAYKPPLAFYDLDARDWLGSLATIYRVTRSIVGVLVRSATAPKNEPSVRTVLGLDGARSRSPQSRVPGDIR